MKIALDEVKAERGQLLEGKKVIEEKNASLQTETDRLQKGFFYELFT
jgi:hypothetical protein